MTNPVFRNGLPMQAMLLEYRIEQVLGAGGFGITYRALDTNLDKDVAIKEYLPGELAMRAPDGNVVAQGSTHEAGYKWGLERFLLEARTLAKFSHPHIVRVLRYFEANRTAYMVMDYEKGDPLKTVLQLDPQPPEEKLKALLAPLLDGLAAVHATGFLHRDIKPDNIFIRANGTPVLIDFGAARQAMGGETKSLTSILTPGYAPLEQYSGEGKQGPWTDLYAMGGVLYRAVVDKNPPDAVSRIRGDSLGAGLATARGKYSEPFLRAIEWALNVDEKKRPQNVEQWKAAVLAERRVAPTVPLRTLERRTVRVAPPPPPHRRRWPIIVVLALFGVAAFGMWKKQRTARLESTAPPPVTASPVQRPAAPIPQPTPAPATQSTPEPARASTLSEEQAQRLKRETEIEFKFADTNRDGFLSPDEVRGRFPVIAREFQRVDKNGDGRISLQEFLQARRIMIERRLGKQ
jgi:serine/threonine protein kinase